MTTSESLQEMLRQVPMPGIDNRHAFITWLKFSHGIMRASVPLLEIAAAKSEGALRDYYLESLENERDHAEWLAVDLETLGEMPYVIDHASAATAGAQYYYLQHVGPHALLGYIAALEFRPMPIEQVDALAKLYGESAMRTVRHHAQEDVDHAKRLASVIDMFEEQARIIVYSAALTARMVGFYLTQRMNLT
jgi:antirestriction protein ArdC